ncbi:MAG: hypothetical protein ACRDQZ_24470 [Mycobacteriales bacterium]
MVIYRALAGAVLLLRLCGVPRTRIEQATRRIAAQMPEDVGRDSVPISLDFDLPVDAITEWYCHPDFLFKGHPRPLRKHGPHPSFETLLGRVSPNLDVDEAIMFLRDTRQLKRRGAFYIPVSRVASHQGNPGPLWAHTLRTLAAKQITAEHNLSRTRQSTWLDKSVDNHNFPVRMLSAAKKYARARIVDVLCDIDAYLCRHANGRRPTEKTVHFGVSAFQFQYTLEDKQISPTQYLQSLCTLVEGIRQRRPNRRRRPREF